MTISINYSAFNSGELSELARFRADLAKYSSGCKTLLNMIPLVQGPVTRRPGTEYIDECDVFPSENARFVPFKFSTSDAYILHFAAYAPTSIYYYKDGAQIQGTGGAYTTATPYAAADVPDLDFTQSADTLFITHPDHAPRKLVRSADDSWAISEITFDEPPFLDENINESVTITASNIVGDITLTSTSSGTFTADMVGGYFKFRETIESKYEEWTADSSLLDLIGDSGYLQYGGNLYAYNGISVVNKNVTWAASSTASGAVSEYYIATTSYASVISYMIEDGSEMARGTAGGLTSGSCDFADNDELGFSTVYVRLSDDGDPSSKSTHYLVKVGPYVDAKTGTLPPVHTSGYEFDGVETAVYWQYYNSGSGYCEITAFSSGSSVTASVSVSLPLSAKESGVSTWSEGAWSGERGYPAHITFHQDRLFFASTTYQPRTIWGSRTGIYTDFSISDPLADDDALALTLGGKLMDQIQWILSENELYVGTSDAEIRVTNATGDGPITPTSAKMTYGSHNGSSSILPLVAGNKILHLNRQNKKLWELGYSWEKDSFDSADLTILAEHLTRNSGIKWMAYQQEPFQAVWCGREDGKVLSLTYNRLQEVWAWALHDFGGTVVSGATIPGDTEDELWLLVLRDFSGELVQYIERMHTSFTTDDVSDAFYVDCGLTYDGDPKTVDMDYYPHETLIYTEGANGYATTNTILIRTVDDDVEGEEDLPSINMMQWTITTNDGTSFRFNDPVSGYIQLSDYKTFKSAYVYKVVTSVTGLDHVQGQEVQLLVDGQVFDPVTVTTGGVATISGGGTIVHAGFGSKAVLETLNPEIVWNGGDTSQLTIKQIKNFMLGAYKTLGCEIGPDRNNLKSINTVDDDIPMGRPGHMITGFTDVLSFNSGKKRETNVYIKQTDPLPLTVTALLLDVEV